MKSVVLLIFAMVLAAEGASLNGNQKKKTDCECKSRPMEISFVVDNSASIWQVNFTFGLNFIEDFVDLFDISQTAVRVSLVTFGEVVYTADAFGLSQFNNKEDLKAAIAHIEYRAGSRTNTSGGIWYMLRQQMPEARPNVRHVTIVLTDGNSQETDLTIEAADDAHKAGLEVFAIGVGQNISAQELHNIASDNRHVFVVSTYNMLEGIKERLKYEACSDEPYPICKMDPVDLSFVIDSSLSIGKGNFTIGMAFVRDFVDHFEINPSAVRVSAITFGDKVYRADAFGFTSYPSKKPLLDALEGIQWRHGQRTDTGDGIKYMRKTQMSYARPEAAHVCIVITDGESQKTRYTAQQALEAQNQGIMMYAVGVGLVGEHLSEEELRNIAGSSKRVLTVNSYAELNLLKNQLANATCEGVMEALELKSQKYRE